MVCTQGDGVTLCCQLVANKQLSAQHDIGMVLSTTVHDVQPHSRPAVLLHTHMCTAPAALLSQQVPTRIPQVYDKFTAHNLMGLSCLHCHKLSQGGVVQKRAHLNQFPTLCISSLIFVAVSRNVRKSAATFDVELISPSLSVDLSCSMAVPNSVALCKGSR